MRRIFTLVWQDLILSWRNALMLFTAVLLVIMAALVWFLPESLSAETLEVVYDASPDKALESYLRAAGAEESAFVDSTPALETALEDTARGIGVVYEGNLDDPRFRLYTVGRLAEENVNLLKATLDSVVRAMRGEATPGQFAVETLRPPSTPIPLNLSVVPVAMVFDVVLLGFTFGAVMIFQEKQEGVNKAYRVSPASTLDYILSKNLLFIALSTVYGALLVFIGFQFDADYGRILLLVILTSSMMTLLGLAIAVFFNNISEWFFVGIGVLVLNMLPVFSYSIPTFAPAWMTLIPSYPVLFGVRDLLFPRGGSDFLTPLLLQLLLFNLVAFVLAYVAVDRKLMRAT